MVNKYEQTDQGHITSAVDKLQQEVKKFEFNLSHSVSTLNIHDGFICFFFLMSLFQFKCCGSHNSSDWVESLWVRTGKSRERVVPDSCCKTPAAECGKRDHPSNIYKVEVSANAPVCMWVSSGFSSFHQNTF